MFYLETGRRERERHAHQGLPTPVKVCCQWRMVRRTVTQDWGGHTACALFGLSEAWSVKKETRQTQRPSKLHTCEDCFPSFHISTTTAWAISKVQLKLTACFISMCAVLQDITWGSQDGNNERIYNHRLMSILDPQPANSHHVGSWSPVFVRWEERAKERNREERLEIHQE